MDRASSPARRSRMSWSIMSVWLMVLSGPLRSRRARSSCAQNADNVTE
jgi:hypothetical protein